MRNAGTDIRKRGEKGSGGRREEGGGRWGTTRRGRGRGQQQRLVVKKGRERGEGRELKTRRGGRGGGNGS